MHWFSCQGNGYMLCLDLRAYITTLLGPGPACQPPYSQQQEFTTQTQFHSSSFSPPPVLKQLRSCELHLHKARAPLAQGVCTRVRVCVCTRVCVLECRLLWLLKRIRGPPTYCVSTDSVTHKKNIAPCRSSPAFKCVTDFSLLVAQLRC